MLKIALCLAFAASSAAGFCATPPSLEPSDSYVFAEDRIPGFKEARNVSEGWLLDPVPASWKTVSLDGKWKLLLKRTGDCVDYYSIDKNFGFDDMGRILAKGYDFSAWEDVDVPLPLGVRKENIKEKGKPGFIACYQREIVAPDFKKGESSVHLKFHGAGFRTDVWIDGSYVGFNNGYYAPFELDATPFLQPGAKASLVVKCVEAHYKGIWLDSFDAGIFAPVALEVGSAPFAKSFKLAPDLAKGAVDGQFEMAGGAAQAQAEVSIEEAKTGKLAGAVSFAAKAGINSFSVKLNAPHEWSPEDPFLYVCKAKLDGKDAGVARFGYRSIEIKAGEDGRQHFFLNGKRLYLRIFEFNHAWQTLKNQKCEPIPENAWSRNYQGRLRESMLAMKFANVNAFRPHSSEMEVDETFLNLCDELGFIVNLDWHGSTLPRITPEKPGEKNQDYRLPILEKSLPAFKDAMTVFHNHPSLCLISFGNEFYDHLISSGSYDGIIEKYMKALHSVDLQKRPSSGSAGRPTYKHDAKVDFVDDHQYIGVYYGSWDSVVQYIKSASAATKAKFGASIPFINTETGYVSDDRIHGNIYRTLNPLLRQDAFDKDAYIKLITGKTPEEAWARLALNNGGVRPYYTDLVELKKRKALLHVKRYIEMFRMNRAYDDGVSLNISPDGVISLSDPDSHENVFGLWPKQDPANPKNVIIEPIYAFRRAFAPVQTFADIENFHPIAGAKTKAPLLLVNDSLSDVAVDLVAQLRESDGSVKEALAKKGLAVRQGEALKIPFELSIPGDCPSGKAVLELYLIENGKKIAENAYDLYTQSQKDLAVEIPKVKLALYDNADDKFAGLGGKSTKEILKSLKVDFVQIKDFKSLGDFKVLVIGANSLDDTVSMNGKEIAKWISAGGRLLMFEQCVTGAVPWSSTERIYRMGAGSFAEFYFPKHPAFKGVENDMAWESPMGSNRELFETCFALNDAFLSVAATAHYDNQESPKAIIVDRKMGEGEYFLSAVGASSRFGKDATLTRYVKNLLAYMASGSVSQYAASGKDLAPSASRIMSLRKEDATFIDIRGAANRGFVDDGSGNGWTGFGSDADFRNIKPGFASVNGLVPFEIADPAKNGGKACIVLAGPQRPNFPKESARIPVGRKCESLFFLQTCMYVEAQKGESVLDYEILYSDGSKAIAPMRDKVDIGDWWQAQDYDNAAVVYRDGDKCLFAAEWTNPSPNKTIASVKAVSKGNAIPIILAISAKCGSQTQSVDRTELDDNRK